MQLEHDFKKYPELRNSEMTQFYFMSPHKQIVQDFRATCVKVHDGDTIRLRWSQRDFDFPLRFLDIDTKELKDGGDAAREWLESKILNHDIDILINPANRVEKWGRLLGKVLFNGLDMGTEMMNLGLATPFSKRNQEEIPNPEKTFSVKKWV